MDYTFRCRLEDRLFHLHLDIFSWTCSVTLRQDTQVMLDILGFYLPSTMMPMPELTMTRSISSGIRTREPVLDPERQCLQYVYQETHNTNCVDRCA